MMMVLMMQTYKMNVIWWSNKVFTYYNFVYLLWNLRKENNKYVIDPLSQWTTYCNHRRESWLAKYPLKWSYSVLISFSTSAYILETGGIENVLTVTEAKVEPSSPRKVSSSKSGAFSLSGKSSFSDGTLIGLLSLAIATVRGCFFQKVAVLSHPGLKKKMVANGKKISSTYYPIVN